MESDYRPGETERGFRLRRVGLGLVIAALLIGWMPVLGTAVHLWGAAAIWREVGLWPNASWLHEDLWSSWSLTTYLRGPLVAIALITGFGGIGGAMSGRRGLATWRRAKQRHDALEGLIQSAFLRAVAARRERGEAPPNMRDVRLAVVMKVADAQWERFIGDLTSR